MFFRYKTKFISDIEQKNRKLLVNIAVAPFVGVWIEMGSRGRRFESCHVAPLVGVWIEMYLIRFIFLHGFRRSLRGSVD